MSSCTNKELGQLLHDYELGMLTEEDRHRFAMHLYECGHCLDLAREFMYVSRIIKHDPDARAIVRGLADDVGRVKARPPQGQDIGGGGVAIDHVGPDVVVEHAGDVEDGHLVGAAQHMRLQLGKLGPTPVLDHKDEAVLEVGIDDGLGDLNDQGLRRALEVGRRGDEFKLRRH